MLGRYNTVFTHLTILFVLLAVTLSNTMSPIKLDSPASSSQGELSSNEETGNPVLDVATLLKTMDFAATVSTTICREGNAACVIGRSLTSRFESWCDLTIETRESTEKEQACYTLYQPSSRTSIHFTSPSSKSGRSKSGHRTDGFPSAPSRARTRLYNNHYHIVREWQTSSRPTA